MVKIIRFSVFALCCWALTATYAWFSIKPVTPLVGGKSAASARLAVAIPDVPTDAQARTLGRAKVWRALPKDKADAGKNDDFLGPPRPVFWDLVATVRTATQRSVVLRSETGEVKTVAEGGVLPDGQVLVKLGTDTVEIRPAAGGKVRVVKTYVN